jgi:uncharacterized protein (DUF305 family)
MQLSRTWWRRPTGVSIVIAAATIIAATSSAFLLPHGTTTSQSSSFMAENDAAMHKMMRGMAIQPSGDVDRDFVAMMVAHHQGAIEMAQAELRHGRNEQLRRLAQEIIVTQGQEIVTMRLALGHPLVSAASSPDREALR